MVNKIVNEKEFLALIDRYESITLEEIIEALDENLYHGEHDYDEAREVLSGFGRTASCTLCAPTMKKTVFGDEENCDVCMYSIIKNDESGDMGCIRGNDESRDSYNDISDAETPEKLLEAYKKRATFMRKIYKLYKNQ